MQPTAFHYCAPESCLPSELICTVCHDVAGLHSACPSCKNTFCQNCVHKWFNTQKNRGQGCTCPYCRRKLRFSDMRHDPAIQQQLDQLLVHCANEAAGCQDVLPRARVAAHLQHECWAQRCTCRHCGLAGIRRDIHQHEANSCPHRPVPCPNAAAGCTSWAPCDLVQNHLDYVCAYQPRPCPACNQDVARKDWACHLQQACPAQQPCPLRLYGCSFSGTAAEVQQHSQQCNFVAKRQQLLDSPPPSAAGGLQGSLSKLNLGELPAGCLFDVYSAFAAPTISNSTARASERLMQAVPTQALPPSLQLPADWLERRMAAVQMQNRPAVLAAQTAPQQIAAASYAARSTANDPEAHGGTSEDGSISDPYFTNSVCCGLSPAECLALGLPQCFKLVGLASEPWLEAAWRVLLNLGMLEWLTRTQHPKGDVTAEWPSSFLLYTTALRAWDSVTRILGSQQQRQEQQAGDITASQQQFDAAGGAAATGADASGTQAQPQQQWQQMQQQQQRRSHDDVDDDEGSNEGSEEEEYPEADQAVLPGLQRGLHEYELHDLTSWMFRQKPLLKAIGDVALPVLQMRIALVSLALLPGEEAQVHDIILLGGAALMRMFMSLAPKKSSKRTAEAATVEGRSSAAAAGSSRAAAVRPLAAAAVESAQLERGPQPGSSQRGFMSGFVSAVARAVGMWQMLEPGAEAAVAHGIGSAAWAGRWPQGVAAGTEATSAAPRGLGLGLPRAHACQQQQPAAAASAENAAWGNNSDIAAAIPTVAAAGGGAPSHLNYSAALQTLQQLGSSPAVLRDNPRVPHYMQGLALLESFELASAVTLLHHMRASHVEISLIPDVDPLLYAGFRGFWATSILAGVHAWLGSGFRLSWQAVSVLNDMVVVLVDRMLKVLGETFYDPVLERLPLTPEMAMAAAQLVFPGGLVSEALPRLLRLSAVYRDEECEDLSEVFWAQLAHKLGLVIELDKLVTLVDERLPVQNEDEDEDEDDDSDNSDDDGSDSYTTEEYQGEDEQSQRAGQQTGGEDEESEYTTDDEYMEDAEQQQPDAAAGESLRQVVPAAGTQTSSAAASQGPGALSADADSKPSSSRSSLPGDATGSQQQQQAGGAESGSSSTWQQLESNLGQLAASSAELPVLERQLLQQGVDALALVGSGVAGFWDAHVQQQGSRIEHDAAAAVQHEAEAAGQAGSSSSSGSGQLANMAAAVAAAGALPEGVSCRLQLQQQQQQQQQGGEQQANEEEQGRPQPDDKAHGDVVTHGVVLLAGLVEHTLQQLVLGAGKVAAQDAIITAYIAKAGSASTSAAAPAAAAELSSGDAVQIETDGSTEVPSSKQTGKKKDVRSPAVCINAWHVLLAAAGDEDLKELLIDRPITQQASNPVAVAWAGVVPHLNQALLPARDTEPVTLWLSCLAAGCWAQNLKEIQQQQHQQAGEQLQPHQHQEHEEEQQQVAGLQTCRVLFPADLRYYCGEVTSFTGLPHIMRRSDTTDSTDTACDHVAAGASAGWAGAAIGEQVLSGTGVQIACCFMSGYQCSRCAAATASIASASLDTKLGLLQASLDKLDVETSATAAACDGKAKLFEHGFDRQRAKYGTEGGNPGPGVNLRQLRCLTDEQLSQLIEATRLYHLQQPWWWESAASGDDTCAESDTDISMDIEGESSSASVAAAAAAAAAAGQDATTAKNIAAGSGSAVSDSKQCDCESLPLADQMQLLLVQDMLQPLRDVVALREICIQQQQAGTVWPRSHFSGMVYDALRNVTEQRQHQQSLQHQVKQLVTPGFVATAAAAAAVDGGGGSSITGLNALSGPAIAVGANSSAVAAAIATAASSSATTATPAAALAAAAAEDDELTAAAEMDIDDEALDVLAYAAEDFLVQQFRTANELVLHAGRQEVGPGDLRVALMTHGYGHLLPMQK